MNGYLHRRTWRGRDAGAGGASTELVDWIARDSRSLVLEFFADFSRAEYALKHEKFAKKDGNGNALADWKRFANSIETELVAVRDREFVEARGILLGNPPRKQVLAGDGSVIWRDNPRRPSETDAQYLLRLVRDVRNNLFHGGKYRNGPESGAERNTLLLRAGLTILRACLALHSGVQSAFYEAL